MEALNLLKALRVSYNMGIRACFSTIHDIYVSQYVYLKEFC